MATSRHPGYDNCKIVFIFYVVLIHLCNYNLLEWSNVTDQWSPFMKNAFQSYSLWHEKLSVPGFVFLSGFFGKSFLFPKGSTSDQKRFEGTISVLLTGGALVQLVYLVGGALFTRAFLGEWEAPPLYLPLWDKLETWYLFALLVWRMATPLIGRLRYPLASSLLIAFIGLHAQMDGPKDTRMRILHFLPYYVAGLGFEESYWLDRVRRPRWVGSFGIFFTFYACWVLPPDYLSHVYFVSSWELTPHLVFLLQYVLCGVEVLSVILVARSISVPILPFAHANSTLAIYEWHWPIVGVLTWGEVPFTSLKFPGLSNPSGFLFAAQNLGPITLLVLSHLVAYIICLALGSEFFWRLVRPISIPNCSGMFLASGAPSNKKSAAGSSACCDIETAICLQVVSGKV